MHELRRQGCSGYATHWARIGHEIGFLRCWRKFTAKITALNCEDVLTIESMRTRLEGWGSTIELHPQLLREAERTGCVTECKKLL